MSIHLPAYLSDGAVLQRDKPIVLRGSAEPLAEVTVTLDTATTSVVADEHGAFTVTMPPHRVGGPFELAVEANGECATVRDVLFGDVWLCAGQSNMVLPMERVRYRYPDEMSAENAHIRQFKVADAHASDAPDDDVRGRWKSVAPQMVGAFSAVGYFFAKRMHARYGVPIGLYVAAVGGSRIHAWMRREDLSDFPQLLAEADAFEVPASQSLSVPAYDDAWAKADFDDSGWETRELDDSFDGELAQAGVVWFRKTLTVPQSMAGKPATMFLGTLADADETFVNGAFVGGTGYRYPPREYAVPRLTAGKCVVAVRLTMHGTDGGVTYGKQRLLNAGGVSLDLNGEWKFRRESRTEVEIATMTSPNYVAAGLYNGMVAPLRGLGLHGILWYQGESDDADTRRYDERFHALIRGWREEFGGELPFLFAELAQYRENAEAWKALRRQQKSALTLPNTGMTATYDLGENDDLHPQGKREVGARFARLAMQVAFGESVEPSPFTVVLADEA